MQIGSKIKLLINWILDLIFPQKCLGCQAIGTILCQNCISRINPPRRQANGEILAIFDYQDPLIKKIIWNLKYYRYRQLGLELGRILYETLLEDISDIRQYSKGNPIMVIPVPISFRRARTRGYNQAFVIARGFCNSGKENFDLRNNIVFKKRETIPQVKIKNRQNRLKNIQDSFEIKRSELVEGKTIIIIDDVTTTGGTINELTKILKEAKAKKVVGFAVAH